MRNLSKIKNLTPRHRKAIAIGGGLLRLGETLPIDQFIVKESGKRNPVVLFIPTASADLPAYILAFTRVYKKLGCKVKILRLIDGVTKHKTKTAKTIISTADIIYIGGGDYDLLNSTWKKLEVIPLIKSAYENGVLIAGLSAGCAVLYEYLVDGDDVKNHRLKCGFGILQGIVIPHYKPDTVLPKEFSTAIHKKNILVTAIEDGCGVFYKNERLQGAVTTGNARAFTINPPYVRNKPVILYLHK